MDASDYYNLIYRQKYKIWFELFPKCVLRLTDLEEFAIKRKPPGFSLNVKQLFILSYSVSVPMQNASLRRLVMLQSAFNVKTVLLYLASV